MVAMNIASRSSQFLEEWMDNLSSAMRYRTGKVIENGSRLVDVVVEQSNAMRRGKMITKLRGGNFGPQ
jgi:hypothetical protein